MCKFYFLTFLIFKNMKKVFIAFLFVAGFTLSASASNDMTKSEIKSEIKLCEKSDMTKSEIKSEVKLCEKSDIRKSEIESYCATYNSCAGDITVCSGNAEFSAGAARFLGQQVDDAAGCCVED